MCLVFVCIFFIRFILDVMKYLYEEIIVVVFFFSLGWFVIVLVLFFFIFVSFLVNWFGCWMVFVMGCMVFVFSLVIVLLVKNLIVLYVVFSVIGIGVSCVLVLGLVMVWKCFDKCEVFVFGIVLMG